jgi:hypothetical protein
MQCSLSHSPRQNQAVQKYAKTEKAGYKVSLVRRKRHAGNAEFFTRIGKSFGNCCPLLPACCAFVHPKKFAHPKKIARHGKNYHGGKEKTSMKPWRIEQATPEHIPAVAAHMREADRREVWAYSRHKPEEALRVSLSRSLFARTVIVDGLPVLMYGVGVPALLGSTGSPWLLATDAVYEVLFSFLKYSRVVVRHMQSLFPRLENYVHADNALSVRWLRWCGFSIDDTPELFNGEPFYLFWRNSDV